MMERVRCVANDRDGNEVDDVETLLMFTGCWNPLTDTLSKIFLVAVVIIKRRNNMTTTFDVFAVVKVMTTDGVTNVDWQDIMICWAQCKGMMWFGRNRQSALLLVWIWPLPFGGRNQSK